MNLVPFTIDEDSKVKRYYQLYSLFAEHIASGKILAGEKLPSIRTVAEQLNLARNTVVKAYELLEEEGYIFSYEKSGFFVKDRNTTAFIHQNLQKSEDVVPTVDSIINQRKGSEVKPAIQAKAQELSEFTDLIKETSRPSTVSQSELDAVLNSSKKTSTSTDIEKTEKKKKMKEDLDEKVAAIMQQIQWDSDDADAQTLTQEELDAVLNSGIVTTVEQEPIKIEDKLADIMNEIRSGLEDDESQTLSQSELDNILATGSVVVEQELISTNVDSTINMGSEEDFENTTTREETCMLKDEASPFGTEHFRTTVTEFLSIHKKISCTPKQLVAGANIEELIANTLQVILSQQKAQPKAERPRGLLRLAQLAEAGQLSSTNTVSDKIAIPSNGADCLQFLSDVGFSVAELFCDIHGVTLSELTESGACVLVTTTTSANTKRREELLSWVAQNENHYILEYDKEANGAVPSLQGQDITGRVIYAGAASDMVPKFHSSWAVLPVNLLNAYYTQFGEEELELSQAEQDKLVDFIESGELDQYLSNQDL